MPRTAFIREFTTGRLAIHPEYLQGFMPTLISFVKNGITEAIEFSPSSRLAFFSPHKKIMSDAIMNGGFPDKEEEPDTVAVVPVQGPLTKGGTPWDFGGDEIADMISTSFAAENVKAVVLDVHSPGGSTFALQGIKGAMKKRNKPVIAAVNSMSMSAGYYISAMADQVVAVDEMAEVGSIGVMAEVVNFDGFFEDNNIQIHRIVPPESKHKNASFFKAREGDYDDFIDEELTPWAQHFQQFVKDNRPGLKAETEGIISGKTFYASQAKDIGLIDDTMPMDDIIQLAFDRANRDNKLNHFFNS